MEKLVKKEKDCSGCHACAMICPKGCITMVEDDEGFLYPQVDAEHCIKCGLCLNACQRHNPIKSRNIPIAYAAKNKDNEVRMASSSGGVFTAIAEYIIDKGGIVFGAAFDDRLNVRHVGIDTKNELFRLRGSKYVQSSLGNSFMEVRKHLDTGRPVLFTGTPCQCDGLLHFLRKPYENLYVQDIICHGVPSPLAWQKYLELRTIENGKIDPDALPSFRNKDNGWRKYTIKIKHRSGAVYQSSAVHDAYLQAFLQDADLRPSCYACKSKTLRRNTDVTLADFWGVEHLLPEFHDNMGTSLVLVSSKKGEDLLADVSESLALREIPLESGIRRNPAAFISVSRPSARKVFYKRLNHSDFNDAFATVTEKSFAKRVALKSQYYWYLLKKKMILHRQLRGIK